MDLGEDGDEFGIAVEDGDDMPARGSGGARGGRGGAGKPKVSRDYCNAILSSILTFRCHDMLVITNTRWEVAEDVQSRTPKRAQTISQDGVGRARRVVEVGRVEVVRSEEGIDRAKREGKLEGDKPYRGRGLRCVWCIMYYCSANARRPPRVACRASGATEGLLRRRVVITDQGEG